MSTFFTEREFGSRPAIVEAIDGRVWGGLYSLIQTRIDDGSFGYRFAEQCPDGQGPCGCDAAAFGRVLQAEIPNIGWPLSPSNLPDTFTILDLLEFCAAAVGRPIEGYYHSFWRHNHLSWEREPGLAQFVSDVNLLFRCNGIAYELTSLGQIARRFPGPVSEVLSQALFRTGDDETDKLLEDARRRFVSPKLEDRQDALEKLWDAFERLKTLEPGPNKRAQADALLDRVAAPNTRLRETLGREALELTAVGNTFRIRHSETTQEPLTSLDQVDYLFMRMFAFVRLTLRANGQGG